MTAQTDIFGAIAAKNAAIDAVERAADGEWLAKAAQVILAVAKSRATFTTDHLWAAGLESPREPRALGAAVRASSRVGLIEPTGEYVQSGRKDCHRRPVRVWRLKQKDSKQSEGEPR